MEKYKNYINGEFLNSQSGKTFKTINPSSEIEFAEVTEAEEYEVNLAVESAAKALMVNGQNYYLMIEQNT